MKAHAPAAAAHHNGRRIKVAPADWERARKWWVEGVKVTEIAGRLGVSDPTVHNHAAAHDWPPRPNARKAHHDSGARPPEPDRPKRREHLRDPGYVPSGTAEE